MSVSENAQTMNVPMTTRSTTSRSHSISSATSYYSTVEVEKKPPLWSGTKFLPSGDCLPAHFNMALIKKLPMFPTPTGPLELYTQNLGEQPYQNKNRNDFDLSDPNNQCIDTEYNPLTDPHLIMHLNKPRIHKRLQQRGLISHDDKVRCTQKQFNQYSKWLQHIGRQQFRKRHLEERKMLAAKKLASGEPDGGLKVALIHTEMTEEEISKTFPNDQPKGDSQPAKAVIDSPLEDLSGKPSDSLVEIADGRRGSLLAVSEASEKAISDRTSEKVGSDKTDTCDQELEMFVPAEECDRQLALVRQQAKEEEEQRTQERHRRAATDAYIIANQKHRKRQKRELQEYKKTWQNYLNYLAEAEERRRQNNINQIKEGWHRPHVYAKQFEDPPPISTESSQARRERFETLLQDELNRRWQKQAGKLKAQKDNGRKKFENLEDTYTRNIYKAFKSTSQVHRDTCDILLQEDHPAEETGGSLKSQLSQPPTGQTDARFDSFGGRPLTTSKPGAASLSERPSVRGQLSFADPKVKFQHFGTGERFSKRRRESNVDLMTYPTKCRLLDADEPHPEDEVLIYLPQELVLQTGKKMPQSESSFDSSSERTASEPGLEDFKALMSTHQPPLAETKRAEQCDKLTEEERKQLEQLIERLLKDLAEGRLDQEDIMKLTTICASLIDTNLTEQATSTTSLGEERTLRGISRLTDTSTPLFQDRVSPSIRDDELDVFKTATSDLSSERQDGTLTGEEREFGERDIDELASGFVEDVVKTTVCRLSSDLQDGTLTREDVREIGSAVASVILGEIRSDSTILEKEIVVPTLERLLKEGDEMEDEMLDQTMASLLSAYDHVSRRTDKSVCKIVKDFVVELLQRTEAAMKYGRQNKYQFLTKMEECQKTPLQAEMDLPCPHEVVEVMNTAVIKLQTMAEVSPVLCELVKVILDTGQAIFTTRHESAKSALPTVDADVLEQMGTSACGLEVALEVAATVADGLYNDMVDDQVFEHSLYLSLAPSFFLVLLICWKEMTAAVPKETVGLQTTPVEENMGFGPTLAEDVILLTLHRLWKDIVQDCLSPNTVTLLSMQVALIPVQTQPPCPLETDEEGNVFLSTEVTRKISAMSVLIRGESVQYQEVQRLMAVVLQTYIKEELQRATSKQGRLETTVPPEVLQDSKQCRYHMMNLIQSLVSDLLKGVLTQAQQQEGMRLPSRMNLMLVRDILQLMSDCALADIKDSLEAAKKPPVSITSSSLDDIQLQEVVRAITGLQGEQQVVGTVPFLQALVKMMESSKKLSQGPISLCTDLRNEGQLIRQELGKMAEQMCQIMSRMTAPSRQHVVSSSVPDKMTRFLIHLLHECQEALLGRLLTPQVMYSFLASVAPSMCDTEGLKDCVSGQLDVLACLIQDLHDNEDKSHVFKKLVTSLSKMSIETFENLQVAESMAAIAHVLTSVEPQILNQFVQSTLYSLLATLRGTETAIISKERDTVPQFTTTTGKSGKDQVDLTTMEMKDSGSCSVLTSSDDRVFGESLDLGTSPCEDSGADNNSKLEIRHEADIIIYMTLYSLMEQLISARPTVIVTPANMTETMAMTKQDKRADQEAKKVISNLKDVTSSTTPPPCEDFSDLDPTIAAYAQDLLMQVTRHMESDSTEVAGMAEEVPTVNPKAIASIILSKTIKSIETGLSSGKINIFSAENLATDENVAEGTPSILDYSGSTSLTSCVTITLRAVRSELDLLDLTTPAEETEGVAGPSSAYQTDRSHTVKMACRIVDFLIKQLQEDTEGDKVEFRFSAEKRLSVVGTSGQPKVNNWWSASPTEQADIILQTFRRVLKDMQAQNQFFNPEAVGSMAEQSTEMFTLPSLPFLLDEFILSHLQNITTQLLRMVQGQDIDKETMNREAVLLACTLNSITKEKIADFETLVPVLGEDQDSNNKRLIILKFIKKYVTKLLFEICGDESEQIQSVVRSRRTSKQKAASEEVQQHQQRHRHSHKHSTTHAVRQNMVVFRPLSHIKSDLSLLLATINSLKNSVEPEQEEEEEEVSDQLVSEQDVVIQTINQIIACVKKERVAQYILKDLYKIFFKDATDTDTTDSQMLKLLEELESLAQSVVDGKVPRAQLASIAAEIGLLEKRHVEDPRSFAQQIRRASLNTTDISPEYLKMAVADLLFGYRTTSEPMSSRERSPSLHGDEEVPRRPDDEQYENRLSTNQLCCSFGNLSSRESHSLSLVHSSIDARTVSKTYLLAPDDSTNRECNFNTVYATQVCLKTIYPDRNIIHEQSEPSHTLSENVDSSAEKQHRDSIPPLVEEEKKEEDKNKEEKEYTGTLIDTTRIVKDNESNQQYVQQIIETDEENKNGPGKDNQVLSVKNDDPGEHPENDDPGEHPQNIADFEEVDASEPREGASAVQSREDSNAAESRETSQDITIDDSKVAGKERKTSQDSGRESRKTSQDSSRRTRKTSQDSSRGTRKTSQDSSRGTRKTSQDIGKGTRKTSQDIGKGTRKTSQDIGEGTRKMMLDIDREPRRASWDVGRGIRKNSLDIGRGTRKASLDSSRETRKPNQVTGQDSRKPNQDTAIDDSIVTGREKEEPMSKDDSIVTGREKEEPVSKGENAPEGQGGRESTSGIGGRGNRSEESLDSTEGDCNRSAIRTLYRQHACRMDEVKGLDTLPSSNSLGLFMACQRGGTQQKLLQNSALQPNLHLTHQLKKSHEMTVQPNKIPLSLSLQRNESQRLTLQPVQQNIHPHVLGELNLGRNQSPYPSVQSKRRCFQLHQIRDQQLPRPQNKSQQYLVQHSENQHFTTSQNTAQHLFTHQNISQHLAFQQSNTEQNGGGVQDRGINLPTGYQHPGDAWNTPNLNTSGGRTAISVEHKDASKRPQLLQKITATHKVLGQPANACVEMKAEVKCARGLQRGHTKDSSFSTSPTSSRLFSQTKLHVVLSECVSPYSPVSVAAEIEPVDGRVTLPAEKPLLPGSALRSYLEKPQYSSQHLTSLEKRAQQKAFASGFSIFDSKKKDNVMRKQKQRHNRNVNRVGSECLKNGERHQPLAQITPNVPGPQASFAQEKSHVNADQLSTSLRSESPFSTQNICATAQKTTRSQRDVTTCREPSLVPHPPSSHSQSPIRDCAQTGQEKYSSGLQSTEYCRWLQRSMSIEKSDTSEIQSTSQTLPASLHPRPPVAENRLRKKDCVNTDTGVGCSVTLPLLPAPPSRKGVDRGEVTQAAGWSAATGGGAWTSLRGERNRSQRKVKENSRSHASSHSVMVLPHPPKGAPEAAVNSLRLTLRSVIKGLKTTHHGSMDEQYPSTEEQKTEHGFAKQLKTDYETTYLQPKNRNISMEQKQKRGHIQEPRTEKKHRKDEIQTRSQISSVLELLHSVGQPQVPHPPPQQPMATNQRGHSTPLVNKDERAVTRRHGKPRHLETVSVIPGEVRHSQGLLHPSGHAAGPSLPAGGAHRNAHWSVQAGSIHIPQCPDGGRPVEKQSKRGMKAQRIHTDL